MRFAECQEVVAEIIFLGPAASEALPLLRRMASDPQHRWAVQAALTVYESDGSTNVLAEAVSRETGLPVRFWAAIAGSAALAARESLNHREWPLLELTRQIVPPVESRPTGMRRRSSVV